MRFGSMQYVVDDAREPDDGVDHELRAWIKSLAKPSPSPGRNGPPEFSREDAEYLRRVATDGTLKAALQEGEPDLAD